MNLDAYRRRLWQEKQEVAIGAVVELFLAQGYDRTSLAQVAKTAGISTGTLFRHFPTKADLFAATVRRLCEAVRADHPVPPPGDPRAGLTAIGRGYARLLDQPAMVPILRMTIAENQRFPEVGEAIGRQAGMPLLEWVQGYMQGEVRAGTLLIRDVPLAARLFLGMLAGSFLCPRLLLAAAVIGEDTAEEVIAEAVAVMLARYTA